MFLKKISLFSSVFFISFSFHNQITAMETVEESIQTNLDRLDRHILQTTIKAHRQCTTVTQAKDKYTQYLMREREAKKTLSLLSWCSGTTADVISYEETHYQKFLNQYKQLLRRKERLEKASALFQNNFERGKRLLKLPENDDFMVPNKYKIKK